ncbi:pectinesterase family protein [Arthrobacter burdickii]|uniref:Pectinesterase family protein n=1 Tax=Arthrobacter burdickii TaxID=3035920 RepID=A0ABT8JWI4_9MICC|nr:pectinesterase family protein [Arthrobacter burdickii]MDN4609536.1 pectinesterase family protein [Arthrobacter burdickii]
MTKLITSSDKTRIKLDWTNNSEKDLAGYLVYRANTADGTYTKLTSTPRKGSDYPDTTAQVGLTSFYKVTAVDNSGNESAPVAISNVRKDGVAPAVPVKSTGTRTAAGVLLDWADNAEADLGGYVVSRATSSSGTYTKLTSTPIRDSTFTDTTAVADKVYYYRITAVDLGGYSSKPAQVSVAVVVVDVTAPAAVTGVTATGSATGIGLVWKPVTATDLAGYVVYRAASLDGEYTKLTATPQTSLTYNDTTTPMSVVFFYKVAAVDKSGNESATSSPVSAAVKDTTAPALPGGLTATGTDDSVTLDWADNTETDLTGYQVTRSTTATGTYAPLTETPLTDSTYTDTTATPGTAFFYKVTAIDAAGNTSPAASTEGTRTVTKDTTAPALPGGLTATGTDDSVTLDWADNTETDLTGYQITRSTTATGTYAPLTETPLTDSTYTDTTATPGTAFFYKVTAIDAAGNTSPAASTEGTRTVTKAPVAGANLTVASDGSGDHTTIAAALTAAPANSAVPFVIAIKPGTYREVVNVTKPNVTLAGAGEKPEDVVITYDNAAGTPKPDGTGTYGTSGSATVLIKANNVTTRNLTIENAYKETGTGSEQAVALKTSGDRLVFDTVRLIGDQDTLYVDSPAAGTTARSYFTNSYVEGDVDFIFGRGTAVFDKSTLMASTRGSTSNNGYLTAASTDKSLGFGYLITDSTVLSDAPAGTFHLGRPWQPSGDANAVAQVVIRDTALPAAIKSSPWTDMAANFSWRNARFFEYNNAGPGAVTNPDRPQLSAADAAKYTKWTYLAGNDGWNPTGQTPPPPPADTTAPAVPATPTATAGDSSVELTWTANTDEDLAGYNLYRSTGTTTAPTAANRINTDLLTAPTYMDRTAANGSTYTYVLTAVDRAGNESAVSAPVAGSPVGVPLPAHDILVAADGTGQYTTVQAAVAAATAGTVAKPTVIAVKPGTYRGLVDVSKNWVTIIGTTGDARDVVISYDNAALTINPATGTAYGTGGSQTMLVKGNNVTVKNVTIENAYKETGVNGEQAVALKTTGDRLVFNNVRLLGNQDTLLADSGDAPIISRSYFVNSYIQGDVDFIFGRGTAVFQNSTINALSRGSSSNNGYVFAPSTSDKNPNGFLLVDSTITSNASANTFSLARPWRGWTDGYTKNGIVYNSRGQVTIRNTDLPAAVRVAQPWADMAPNLWTDGRFFEYQNTGAGATINANRPQLTDEQAAGATPQQYLTGADGWNPTAG